MEATPFARKHGTARHGKPLHATGKARELAGLAVKEVESDSTEDDYLQTIERGFTRGMGTAQIEGIIYQLADWWPRRPAKAQNRTEAHRTLLQWLIREGPKPDPPPHQARDDPGPQYEDVVIPPGAWKP